MKLGDLNLLETGGEKHALRELLDRVNATAREYPRDSTVHAEFTRVARLYSSSPAIIEADAWHNYRELDERSNRIARLLIRLGAEPEQPVAVVLESTWLAAAAFLGILKAGAAYVPLDGDMPIARLRRILDETEAKILISETTHLRAMNQLQWECRALSSIICADSNNFAAECEPMGAFSDERIWDMVGDEAIDDITGGGWKDSFTGQWMSRKVMDEYARNVRLKLEPLIDRSKRVLEIGCSSGITLLQIAPLAGRYFGTDLSSRILEKTRKLIQQHGLHNAELAHLAAHETELVPECDFDIVVLNSVVQCFSGHNYLRRTLRQALSKMNNKGAIFLGDLSDLDLRDRFIEDLKAFEQANPGKSYRTQADRSAELYISREFLSNLRHEFPEIAEIEFSRSLGTAYSEMTEYGFDAILHIDKSCTAQRAASPVKHQLDTRAIDAESEEALPERAAASQLAYVIYTSGTTGRPKGSAVEHRAILRLVKNSNFVPLNSQTRFLRTGALSFDASTLELWGPLLNGGSVCHAPAKSALDAFVMGRNIASLGVNTMWLTASLFNRLVDDDIDFAGLRYLLVGGERLSPEHVSKIRRRYHDLVVVNGYGPTENTVFTTTYRIDEVERRDIPIGKPIANSRAYIYNGIDLAPIGVSGELCAAGDGLARGYWKNPGLTAERFVPDPEGDGARMYRTGDLANWRADGNIHFIGRIDDQVKIRGFRIETGEIERCISGYPGILEVAVMARDCGPYGKELAAWFTASAPVDPGLLRRHMSDMLPEYMIPADLMQIERLPLTQSGKVDRRALPAPNRLQRRPGRTAEGETESRLIAIWERVLERPVGGADSNFFECGGHSLKVPALVAAIRQEFGVTLPFPAVFRAPTIRGLAELLIDGARFETAGVDETMVLLNDGSAPLKLFAFPPGRSDALGYGGLARALEGRTSLWSCNFLSQDSRIGEYADAITATQPEGPYGLFGYSGGGRLAYHVAAELERRGHAVAGVIMVDSSRYLARIPVSSDEVDRMVQQFLESDEIRPFLITPLLRDKAKRRIRAYYNYLYNTVDSWTVNCDLHLIVAEQSVESFEDERGRVLASHAAWKDATRGRLWTYRGRGTHNEMLNQPAIAENGTLIEEICTGLINSTRVAEPKR